MTDQTARQPGGQAVAGSTAAERPDPWRRVVYWAALGLLVLLAVVALLMFRAARTTTEAQEKADQLIAALEDAGAQAPSQEQIVRVLGDDGGAACQDPGNALRKATLLAQLTNGASGPGTRPVVADSRVVQGQLLIVQIYCPDELQEFEDTVASLELQDVVNG
ncbi:hypothetical protein [Puerhibacterium puerhi]|uniref:hypothetical protein n=1 Tax=Puerhibacterium puerhi TaxID=2692623 RepID=UPI001F37BB59|nr:hypothetical protein [Puerhibacterium puerhi]